MSKSEWKRRAQVLRSVALFTGCTDEELRSIDAIGTEIDVPSGRVLVREGEAGLEAFVVMEGRARVSRNGETIAHAGPGSLIGEMALMSRGKRNARVEADTPMRLIVLSIGEFEALLDTSSGLRARIEQTIAERFPHRPVGFAPAT